MDLDERAAKVESPSWNKDHTSFTALCPLANGTPHRIACSSTKTKCLGLPGVSNSACSDDRIAAFFANSARQKSNPPPDVRTKEGESVGADEESKPKARPQQQKQQSTQTSSARGTSETQRSTSDDILRRVPPQNIEAEQSILGAILLENSSIEEAIRVVKTTDFYRETHRVIFDAMLTIHQKIQAPIDVVTLCQELRTQKALEQIGGTAYISELASFVPTAQNIASYARIVRDMAVKREIASKATWLASLAYDGVSVDGLLGEAERLLKSPSVAAPQSDDPILSTIDKALVEVVSANSLSFTTATTFLESYRDERNKSVELCEGLLRTRNLSLLVGRAWAGKTTLAANLARALLLGEPFLGRKCKPDTKVAYLALERNGGDVADLFEKWGIADRILFLDRVPVGEPREMARALAYEIHNKGVEIAIIDHLIGMIHLEDGNDYVGVSRALAPFNAVAKYTSSNVFLLHHQPKTAGMGNEINVMGSEAFRAATDCLLEASKIGNNFFFRAQSRGVPDVERLRIVRGDDGLLISEPGVDGLKAEILSTLAAAEGPCTSKKVLELSPELQSVPAKNVLMALKRLVDENHIWRIGKGKARAPFHYGVGPKPEGEDTQPIVVPDGNKPQEKLPFG